MLNSRLLLLLLPLSAVALAARPVSFNEDIRPILADNCFSCHGTDTAHRKGDRRLDTPEGATAAIDGVRALVLVTSPSPSSGSASSAGTTTKSCRRRSRTNSLSPRNSRI